MGKNAIVDCSMLLTPDLFCSALTATFIFIQALAIVTCVRSQILQHFLAFCFTPTHIYRHAATDELNLDQVVAKVCQILLLIFCLTLTLHVLWGLKGDFSQLCPRTWFEKWLELTFSGKLVQSHCPVKVPYGNTGDWQAPRTWVSLTGGLQSVLCKIWAQGQQYIATGAEECECSRGKRSQQWKQVCSIVLLLRIIHQTWLWIWDGLDSIYDSKVLLSVWCTAMMISFEWK